MKPLMVGLIILLCCSCSSYNKWVDECAGGKANNTQRVFSYTPLGALGTVGVCDYKRA